MIRPSALLWVSVAVLAVAAAGCGGESYPRAPVSGTVELDGEPLAGAQVGFEPLRAGDALNAGPGSYATTDQQGHYRLEALDRMTGAVVGKHRVWIRTFRAKEGPNGTIITVVPERLPARYNSQTELEFTVPAEGTDRANFDLTSR
jgi:hypothetical protein